MNLKNDICFVRTAVIAMKFGFDTTKNVKIAESVELYIYIYFFFFAFKPFPSIQLSKNMKRFNFIHRSYFF